MNRTRRFFNILFLAVFCNCAAFAGNKEFDRAMDLYKARLYSQSMDVLMTLPEYGKDPVVDGYVAMCCLKQRCDGYLSTAAAFLDKYPGSSLCDNVRREMAYDAFDSGQYEKAHALFGSVRLGTVPSAEQPEFLFKDAYSVYKIGDHHKAYHMMHDLSNQDRHDYTAPSQYCAGYICYIENNLDEALEWFEKAMADERFTVLCNYYMVNCHYIKRDYDYVVTHGPGLYAGAAVPKDRLSHLARMISESYLVKGDKAKADEYFRNSDDGQEKTRADYFFAGSLKYAVGQYKEAVENFDRMENKTDSLGQIAHYQTALSFLGLKNKVGALGAFKSASDLHFDSKMTEDAFFNYAKLAFDLNRDTAPFALYTKTYSDRVRGEKIFAYMALASLQDRDYEAAVNFYDKIDALTPQMENNYVHANYLRGAQLLDAGSYRNAVPYFKAVTYYTPKNDRVNQLARYALGEAYYRNMQYSAAVDQYKELYNASALEGMPQGKALSYNIAYGYYKAGEYAEAAKWFDICCQQEDRQHLADAMLRRGDCLMAGKDYAAAAQAYENFTIAYPDSRNIYPYLQAAIAYGLQKNSKAKIGILSKVADADPGSEFYCDALYEYGRTLSDAKKPAEALEVFNKLVEAPVDNALKAKALLEVGTMLRNSGKKDEALAAYKRVVETMPQYGCNDDAMLAIESIYQSMNKPQEYLSYLETIGQGGAKTEADKEELFFNSAEQQYYAGAYQDALSAFEEFCSMFPESGRTAQAMLYIADCYASLSDKVKACDAYAAVMQKADGAVLEKACDAYASISYELASYEQAYGSYRQLSGIAANDAVALKARIGMMRSSYRAKMYDDAVNASSVLASDAALDKELRREANMVMAKSLMATSRRQQAMSVFEILSGEPTTAEGAEASYIVIQDYFDKADYEKVAELVFKFADAGTPHQYYLAKSFILLGDCYAEQGKMKQAKATFKSIADGYKGKDDEIMSELDMRLEKLADIK